MRSREPHKILCDDRTCEILFELTSTAAEVFYLNVIVITKSETAYIKALEEFLKQIRLLQTVNSYIL